MCYLTGSLVCQTRNIEGNFKAKRSFLWKCMNSTKISHLPCKKNNNEPPPPFKKIQVLLLAFDMKENFFVLFIFFQLTHFLYYFLCTQVKFYHMFFFWYIFHRFLLFPCNRLRFSPMLKSCSKMFSSKQKWGMDPIPALMKNWKCHSSKNQSLFILLDY